MDVAAHCLQHNFKRIAFIGTTKHAGKTTALNGFIRQAVRLGKQLGLVSIGIDGERLDTILGVEKPAIYAPQGTLVVSAERALEQSDAKLEWMEELPISSPLGSIMLARVITAGNVMLAGVRERAHVQMAVQRLKADADFCLVDGAFDRVAAAVPHIVDAAVVAVSAVAGQTVDAVAKHAQAFLIRFQLPQADPGLKAVFTDVRHRQTIGLATGEAVHELMPHQTFVGLSAHPAWNNDVRAIYIPGALTDGIADTLSRHGSPLDVIVSHPAQVLASGDALKTLFRRGHRVCVWDALPVVALAVNPFHIRGYQLPKDALMQAVQAAVPGVPVYDALEDDCDDGGCVRGGGGDRVG